jgi:hypothetical protein
MRRVMALTPCHPWLFWMRLRNCNGTALFVMSDVPARLRNAIVAVADVKGVTLHLLSALVIWVRPEQRERE